MKIKKYTNSAWTDLDKPVKKFATYTDEATTLPLTIEASATDAIENYQVYGTSAGAGVETDNMFDKNAKDTENGYISGAYLTEGGGLTNSAAWEVSEYIEITPNTTYTIVNSSGSAPRFCQYDENKQYITSERYDSLDVVTFTSESNSKYIRLSKLKANDVFMLTSGSTAPASYIPPGYKIPILITSGVTENSFDKDEYLNTYKPNVILNEYGNEISSTVNGYSTYKINVIPEQTYTLKGQTSAAYTYYSRIYWLGSNDEFLGRSDGFENTVPNSIFTFTTPQNCYKIEMQFSVGLDFSDVMLVKGSTAPDHYIPHRYISNYDLFIGDSKLYEDEYLDFVEQKVYKRTENKYDDSTTTDNYRIIWATGALNPDSNYRISDYISVSESTSLTFSGVAYCICYDANKTYLGVWNGEAYKKDGTAQSQTTITIPSGTAFIRLTSTKVRMTSEFMVVANTTVPASFVPYLQPTDPPLPFPTISTYIGENNISVDTTVQPEKVVCEYQGWKPAGDGEMKYYHNGWVNTPPPAKPSWLSDGYEAVLDALTAPSNYYCDLAYVENGIQMVYRVYVSTDTTCQIEHPDNYISVLQSPYSSSFRGFTTYGVRYNNGVWNVATTTRNQDRGQTAYASSATQRAILKSTITSLTNASGLTFEDYR